MSEISASVEVSLGRQGRLVIPAPLGKSLELKEGDRLVARQEADRLVLESEASEGTLCPGAHPARSGGRTDRRTARARLMSVVLNASALLA